MTAALDAERFLAAQAPVWAAVRAELSAGTKRTHWMWFVFPQLRGLGRSPTAHHYGLADLEDAAHYLAHPVLSARLIEAATLLLTHEGIPATRVLGPVDALKLRSSMTLFSRVRGAPNVFGRVLDAFHDDPCERTLALLEEAERPPGAPRRQGISSAGTPCRSRGS